MAEPIAIAKECRWCGGQLYMKPTGLATHNGTVPEFCSADCRKMANNLRAMRGAQLYDLFMAMRYERDLAADLALWSNVCKLAQKWRMEDERHRGGRKSWGDVRKWIRDNPWLNAVVLLGYRSAHKAKKTPEVTADSLPKAEPLAARL